MSHASRDGGDSFSLTADVVDSLQGWLLGRTWSYNHSISKTQAWIMDFLDLMLDWSKVLETQPDWTHYLHHQLLSETSYFRQSLELDGDQSVIQFHTATVLTKRSEIVTWPNRCFAMDSKKDLAFTYDESFISCYDMKTGLLTAEIPVPVPSKFRGPLVVRRGVLCPQGKYFAVILEAMGPSTDPIGAQIRAGRYLGLSLAATEFVWELDDAAIDLSLSPILAHGALGIDFAEFVVCLLELQHTGPTRTHLFRLPSWAKNPVLTTRTATMRWELDDVDILHFSDNSTRLATPFGIFDVESGRSVKPWSFALEPFFQSGKITSDFKTFATVHRDIKGECSIQLCDVDNPVPCRDFNFPGVVHLLAISNHGRFLLLIRRQVVEEKKRAKIDQISRPPQQGSIGVWDCREQEWTPLLTLDRYSSQKLQYWNLYPYLFTSNFSPEAEEHNDVNRVLLYAPPKWKLASNVRKVNH